MDAPPVPLYEAFRLLILAREGDDDILCRLWIRRWRPLSLGVCSIGIASGKGDKERAAAGVSGDSRCACEKVTCAMFVGVEV